MTDLTIRIERRLQGYDLSHDDFFGRSMEAVSPPQCFRTSGCRLCHASNHRIGTGDNSTAASRPALAGSAGVDRRII